MAQVTAETMLSEKGKKLLIVSNYKFARANTNKCGKIRWKCCNAKCTARIYSLTTREESVVERKGDHSHPSDPTLSRQAVSNSLKRKAIDHVMTRPAELIHSELETNTFSSDIIKDDFKRFRQNMSRLRSKAVPFICRHRIEVAMEPLSTDYAQIGPVEEHEILHQQPENDDEAPLSHDKHDLVDITEPQENKSCEPKVELDIIINELQEKIKPYHYNEVHEDNLAYPAESGSFQAASSHVDNQDVVIAETMLSEKGKKLLILKSYKFAKASTSKIGKIRWKCCNAKCTARIYTTTVNEERVVEQRGDHCHASDSTLSRQAVSNSLKRKAIRDLMVRPAKLIHSELETNKFSHDIIKEDIKRMRRNMYCARRKTMPFFGGVELHQYYLKLLGTDLSRTTSAPKDSQGGNICF